MFGAVASVRSGRRFRAHAWWWLTVAAVLSALAR
jgi:hypothetical protein